MKIGHSKASQTFLPQIEKDTEDDISYMDCPGFLDNRGPEIKIANSINIKQSIANSKEVKVVALINYESLTTDRAKGLTDLFAILKSMFGA